MNKIIAKLNPHLGLKNKYHKTVDPLLVKLFHCLPVKRDLIVFNNFNGRGFGDNPKYIAEEIIRRKLPYKLYWVVGKGNSILPKGIKKIKYQSPLYFYIMSRMRIFVNNLKSGILWDKKKSQYYIQTWHGSLIMKYVEREVEDSLGKKYVDDSRRDSSFIDTFLVASEDDKNIIGKWFWYEHELWTTGNPRSDVFFHTTKEQIEAIRKKLGLSKDTKALLYAPTFRDDHSTKGYKIDFEKIIDKLHNLTGSNWVVLVRLHPNAAKLGNLFDYNGNIINACDYPDAQDLCVVANAMITDYSSIMLDMFLQKKPVFLYTNDYDDYIAHSRPMHDIYNKLPCKRNNTEDELLKDIESFDKEVYLKKLKHFMEVDFKSYDDGHASERVVDRIQKVIETDYQSPYYSK